MENKPDRRISGHPLFWQKCVKASWVKQWYGILLSIFGCGSMLLKLLSLAAQLSNSQNVFQPESNSTHNVSENLNFFFVFTQEQYLYAKYMFVLRFFFIKCKMNICNISKYCEIWRPTAIEKNRLHILKWCAIMIDYYLVCFCVRE